MTKRERILSYSIFFIVAVLFLLCFSLWESPLYTHWYGCDASFFSMAGRGITKGWVPYLDFFDLKGPYFFFLEALGQLIHTDRLGVWILEIPFLWASLILMYEIARLFVSRLKSAVILIIVLFLYISTLWGGNTLEEYMLPLSLLVLYLTLRASLRQDSDGKAQTEDAENAPGAQAENAAKKQPENSPVSVKKLSFGIPVDFSALPAYVPIITGVCFGIIAFSKITVGAPVAGVVIAVALCLLLDHQWKALIRYLLLSLLGIGIAVAPVFLYFGYHHAIGRMLYAVFAFAFKRSIDHSEPFSFEWEMKTFGAWFAFVFAVFHFRRLKKEMAILLISMAVMTHVLLHLGVPFIYYFTTVFPVFVLAFAIFLKLYDPLILFANIRQFLCLALIAVLLYFYAHTTIDAFHALLFERRDDSWYQTYYLNAKDIAALIPKQERDQVFSFSIDMTWFEVNQMLPCNPYPINLQFFIALDPSIETELTAFLNETPPKWLVIGDNFGGEIPSLFAIVDQKYDCIFTNDAGNLYLLKD